jgi:microcystin-dependent protein
MSDVPLSSPAAAFSDLVDQFGPVLAEVAKAAVAEAIAAVPSPTNRPGVVQGVDASARTASVLLDGDGAAVTAQVLTELPYTGARVMVQFVPGGAVFVVGFVTSCGIPPGVMMEYSGPITAHADAPSATPSSTQPPPGFLWCAGQAVSRATYAALFAAIGTTHGAGDGSTTFNVPDRRGRLALPLDNMGGTDAGRLSMANTLGLGGGSNVIAQGSLPNVTLSYTPSGSVSISDPSHRHASPDGTSFATVNGGAVVPATGIYNLTNAAGVYTQYSTTGITASFAGSTGNTSALGSGLEHLPPYLLCHVIIKT